LFLPTYTCMCGLILGKSVRSDCGKSISRPFYDKTSRSLTVWVPERRRHGSKQILVRTNQVYLRQGLTNTIRFGSTRHIRKGCNRRQLSVCFYYWVRACLHQIMASCSRNDVHHTLHLYHRSSGDLVGCDVYPVSILYLILKHGTELRTRQIVLGTCCSRWYLSGGGYFLCKNCSSIWHPEDTLCAL
jgi:hypothetical protein